MSDPPKEPFFKIEDLNLHEIGQLFRSGDADTVGRFLRVHLVVEYCVEEHLQKRNPNLGDIGKAKLKYFNKVMLLNPDTMFVGWLIPGLLRLNGLRNKLAHRIDYQLTTRDVEGLLGTKEGAEQLEESWLRLKNMKLEDKLPIHTIEAFAGFACAMLRTGTLLEAKHAEAVQTMREHEIRFEVMRTELDKRQALLDSLSDDDEEPDES